MKKFVFLLIIGFAGIIRLSAQTPFTTHASKAEKYNISYPSDWTVIDKSVSPLLNFGASAPLEDEADKFSENFNVVIDNSNLEGISLEKYRELSAKGIKSYLKNTKIISNKLDQTNDGTPCAIMVYSHEYNGSPLKVLVVMYLANGKAYIVTCTAEAPNFDSYYDTFMNICKSMEFVK